VLEVSLDELEELDEDVLETSLDKDELLEDEDAVEDSGQLVVGGGGGVDDDDEHWLGSQHQICTSTHFRAHSSSPQPISLH
jgi:hypothetical protein